MLLRIAEYGNLIIDALSRAPDGTLVADNVSILVPCHLELDGPKRPTELAEIIDMTSGGVSKVITRLENAGFAEQARGALYEDKRAVSVGLTDKGHALMRSFDLELGALLSETTVLIKDLNQYVE